MTIKIEFSNPQKQPLDELTFHVRDNGVTVNIPALSKHWIEARPHAKYLPLPTDSLKLHDSSAANEWLTEADWFNKEIEWLLQLEHYRFWSYLVFEPACISSILSFLQEATPCYIPISMLTDDSRIREIYATILKNVLAVLCRMVTNKESETEWITKKHLAELLYKKFLISIPMVFDIFVAYGRSNSRTINQLIQTIIKIEPQYHTELVEGLSFMKNALKTIEEKASANEASTSFNDLALYTLDCAYTLNALIEVYPAAHDLCREVHIEQTVTNFYDTTIPKLYNNILLINSDSVGIKYLNHSRVELLAFFRAISYKYIDEVLTNPSEGLLASEHFIAVLQEALSDQGFFIDYQKLYPVETDIDILKQAHKKLDMFKVDFILQACSAVNAGKSTPLVEQANTIEVDFFEPEVVDVSPTEQYDINVQTVLDILPDLEPEFAVKLLSRYENAELAIAAVLEGNLPPDLDSNNPISDEVVEECPKSSALEHVTNLLDDIGLDEGAKIIIKGDKRAPISKKSERRILEDKTTVHELRSRYEEYGYVSENYEDEYDDSYDAMAESETKSVNQQLKHSGALHVTFDEVESEDEESDEENGAVIRDTRRDFCENPEVIRERMMQARNSRFASSRKPPPPNKDVVGKSKGQGQDKDTTMNRHKKDVHKSSRANHNRRQGAAFKRNRGMIPS